MRNDLMITPHDLLRSVAMLAAVAGAARLLYTGLNGMPGFVWVSLLGLAAGTWEHSRKCCAGQAPRKVLSSLSNVYVWTAIGVVAIALLLPTLVPVTAFERGGWLVWVDGVLMLGGLVAVPSARALLAVACMVARRRPARSDRG